MRISFVISSEMHGGHERYNIRIVTLMPIGRILNPENHSINREGSKMIDYKLAFLISGAGYGIVILVMIIISGLMWVLSLTIKRAEKTR